MAQQLLRFTQASFLRAFTRSATCTFSFSYARDQQWNEREVAAFIDSAQRAVFTHKAVM